MKTARRSLLAAAALMLIAAATYFLVLRKSERTSPPSPHSPAAPADLVEQIHNFCGVSCHAYPPPDSFPRQYWRMEVQRGYQFFDKSALALKPPPIESVIRYYEERAPEDFPAIRWPAPSRPLGVRFERLSYPGPETPESFAISHVNLVRLPPPGKAPRENGPLDILACDMRSGMVMLLRPSDPAPAWKVLARLSHPAHAEVVDLDGDGIQDILVANLGNFGPTDLLCGSVVWLRGRPDGSFTPVKLLDNIGRVADVQAADFRGNGKLDLLVAVFGWQTAGELLYLDNRTTDWTKPKFESRVLDERHGTIHVPIGDISGDGKLDFVALFSQAHETIVGFINEGDGKFSKKTLWSATHPGYGSSGIQLVDLNADGKLDVLFSNGDTLDDPHLFKPYHGVQWLENRGAVRFQHHPLTPMYGVHRAVAGRLLGSSRQDIVAVSFLPAEKFPERGKRKTDAIVVLEQTAPAQFERHSLAAVDCDHVTCAVGDLYGTGRLDIVVGNFSALGTNHPVTIWKSLGR